MTLCRRLLAQVWLCLWVVGSIHAPPALAEFNLNFSGPTTGAGGWTYINCNRSGFSSNCGESSGMMGGGVTEFTPFLQEIVTDGTANYFHVIIGDPLATAASDGAGGTYTFGLEYYIELGSSITYSGGGGGGMGGMGGSGTEEGSSSAGVLNNGSNPFAQDAGNGTGNPTVVQIRQVMGHQYANGDSFDQEYLKDTFAAKPLITQNINSSEVNSTFSLDMRGISYSTSNTPGTIVNTLDLLGGQAGLGDFDLATDADNSLVTGGRYTYSNGAGPNNSGGTYLYWDGGFDPSAIADWSEYCAPNQNTGSFNCDPNDSRRTNEGGSGINPF